MVTAVERCLSLTCFSTDMSASTGGEQKRFVLLNCPAPRRHITVSEALPHRNVTWVGGTVLLAPAIASLKVYQCMYRVT